MRIFHYGFIYRTPIKIITGCIPTVLITAALLLIVAMVEAKILKKFEKLTAKKIKKNKSLTENEKKECIQCYKKFDIAIAAGDAIGFFLGSGSTIIIESMKGIIKFNPVVFTIIILQAIGAGLLCYTIITFRIKKVLMASIMDKCEITGFSKNLSRNLSIAIANSIYFSMMNLITVPIGLLQNPVENSFGIFVKYIILASFMNGAVCFISYFLIINKMQSNEKFIKNSLHEETQKLASSTKLSAEISQNQNTAVKEIVATVEDSTALSDNIFQKVQNVTELAQKSSTEVISGAEYLQNNVNDFNLIMETNQNTIKGIKELNDKVESIWEIVSLITEVADQAKIIAFNAELEASSAGEYGKNFHIVASEVRRLSNNIIDDTKEVKEKIEEVQEASNSLLVVSEVETQKIRTGCENVKMMENKFCNIKDSAEKAANSSTEIMDYMTQLSSASGQILATIKQVAQGVDSVTTNTKQIYDSSENLKMIADEL